MDEFFDREKVWGVLRKLGMMPAALTAKRSEMREVDMAWDDTSFGNHGIHREHGRLRAWEGVFLVLVGPRFQPVDWIMSRGSQFNIQNSTLERSDWLHSAWVSAVW